MENTNRRTIKFGTDGWRGVIAEDFTFKNVKIVAQAIADHLRRSGRVAIGYDTRFMSKEYAMLVSEVMTGNKIETIISKKPTPTPMLSYYVKANNLSGGIMITASHNPSKYNGIKFKETLGCSSKTETTQKIESFLYHNNPEVATMSKNEVDISLQYITVLKEYVLTKFIKAKKFKIVIDSMYGAGGNYLQDILESYGHKVITIHSNPNPAFPGINPEPIEINLKELSESVKQNKADIGIATDGDADRVGIVDDKGNVLTPHYVLSLLLLHMKKSRNWTGSVIKTISSTSLLNKIAEKYEMELRETPVGFKYIADYMIKTNVLIGGEESGGNGFKNHIPERDSFLSGLLLVEMLGMQKKKLTEIVKNMEKEFGSYEYKRIDLHVPRAKIDKLFNNLKNNQPDKIAGYKIFDFKTYDGVKFILEDNSWLLIRASGTEPILRLYSESYSMKKIDKLISAARIMANK